VALAGAAVVAATARSATAALIAFAVAETCATAVYWSTSRGRRPQPSLVGARALLRTAAPLAISAIAIYSYYAGIDTVILGVSHSTAEAGVYSAVYRVFLTFNVVAIFAAYANYPLTARRRGLAPTGLASVMRWFLIFMGVYGAIVLGIAEIVQGDLPGLLFGSRFRDSGDTLILLCTATAWYCVGFPYGYNLVALGNARRFVVGALCAGVGCVVLDLLLIPRYGMNGAAVATLASIAAGSFMWFSPWERSAHDARRLVGALSLLTVTGVCAVGFPPARPYIGAITLVLAVCAVPTVSRKVRKGPTP
jgi:O-antigen/teichoic acid export membrane protein